MPTQPTVQAKWTPAELESERKYRFEERCGILADGRTAEDWMVKVAEEEAASAVLKLKLS